MIIRNGEKDWIILEGENAESYTVLKILDDAVAEQCHELRVII